MSAGYTLITGASEGIGKELARVAAEDGQDLVITARSVPKLEVLADELRAWGRDVIVIGADMNDADDVERLWSEATAGRQIDILVNNAGLGSHGHFAQSNWDREATSMEVNMTALTRLMKLAIPGMVERGQGRILNVASVAGFMAGPNMAVYHATKAYVLSLTEGVAAELRGTGVTVTALCPGATQSNFFQEADMGSVRITKGPLPTSKAVAQYGWSSMKAGKQIAVHGLMNKVTVLMAKFAPRAVVLPITNFLMGKPG